MGFRMEQSGAGHAAPSRAESIGPGGDTGGSETSQYPEEKKSTEIPPVVASERGTMPKPADSSAGVAGFLVGEGESERKGLERPAIEGDSPVREAGPPAVEHPSRA